MAPAVGATKRPAGRAGFPPWKKWWFSNSSRIWLKRHRIVFNQVLEHLPDPSAALRELWRVTKPGGQIITGAGYLKNYVVVAGKPL